jgi:glycerol-3-phosphate acyltransferase PlsY
MKIFLFCFLAYLLGSIPFGVIVGKIKKIDLQKHGSGNIGAANAIRTLGFFPGILVLVGDALKGTLALALAKAFLPKNEEALWFIVLGLCAILGHLYSCFLKFKGGKGVATTVGVFLFISWKATLFAFSLWVIVVFLTGYASLASLAASLMLPIFMKLFGEPQAYATFAFLVFLLIVYTHRENIKRLLSGQENKLSFSQNEKGKSLLS